MSQRADLMREIHRAGLRLDDAATAADVAIRFLRDQRDDLIVAAREAGLSYRQIAKLVGVTHPIVIAVVNRAADKLPDHECTV